MRYERRRLLGHGGMGEVWLGTDHTLGRDVALKVPLPRLARDPMFVARFLREARAMARVNHDNVVEIYDVCESEDGPFIVMEYVAGGSLADRLQPRRPIASAETVAIVAQAARALDAAHRQDVVHRDVKPGNLLLRHEDGHGGRTVVLLTDFGIAQTSTANLLTQLSQQAGTADYMAPELFGDTGASPRSDIYALGVVAFECLAGRPPFHADNPVAVALMHIDKAPPALPPGVPPALRQVVERSMAKRPEQRYASAAEVADALEAAVQPRRVRVAPGPRPTETAPTTRQDRPPPQPAGKPPVREPAPTSIDRGPRRKRRWPLAAALAVLLVVAGAAAVRLYGDPGTDPGQAVPADLRAFAPNWPYEKCTRDATAGEHQQERWTCRIDTATTLFLIRYQPGSYRDDKRRDNDTTTKSAGTVALRRGTVTAPGGATGLYREYEVNIAGRGEPAQWIDQIWFDNHPVTSPPLILLLRTPREPDTRQALDRLHKLWDDAGYTRPS